MAVGSIAIAGLESFKKTVDVAEPGDQLGILLRGVDSKTVKRGCVLVPQGHKHIPTDKADAQVRCFILAACDLSHLIYVFHNLLEFSRIETFCLRSFNCQGEGVKFIASSASKRSENFNASFFNGLGAVEFILDLLISCILHISLYLFGNVGFFKC